MKTLRRERRDLTRTWGLDAQVTVGPTVSSGLAQQAVSAHLLQADVVQPYPDDICSGCLGFLIADNLRDLPVLHAKVRDFLGQQPQRNALGLYIISEQFVELFGCVTHLRGVLLGNMASVYGLDCNRIVASGLTAEDESELRIRGMDTDDCEMISRIFGPTSSIQIPVCSFLDKVGTAL
jgi:hypothetical protein